MFHISKTALCPIILLALPFSCWAETPSAPSSHTAKVRTMLDNMIRHGRDRYGKVPSPLFAAILDQQTLDCPDSPPFYAVDPVRLDPGRFANRRNPAGSDVYHDQAMFQAMDKLSRITGDPKYRRAAVDALAFAINHAVDSKGFPAIGGHMYWDIFQDRLQAQGEHHELWNWPLAWELWQAADPQAMKKYAQLMWKWHVVDKTTGETNRHSDARPGYAFSFSSASMISQWAYVGSQTDIEPYRTWSKTVAGYYRSLRNPNTNMFDSNGKAKGFFTTMQATSARCWIEAGRQLDDPELVRWGRDILDAYARYGYDNETDQFYAALNLDGTPHKPKAHRGLVTGDLSPPVGYLAIWEPHVGWQENPLEMAQTYAWAAEKVDRDAYLPTARRFAELVERAWQGRYGGQKNYNDLARLLHPLNIEYYKINGVLHSRQSPATKVDLKAMETYRRGGYVLQAPFDLFADHYGRTIQVMLTMHRLTGEKKWLDLAAQIAHEAIKNLWRKRIFVGHPTKTHYMNTDHVGILLLALLELDEAIKQ